MAHGDDIFGIMAEFHTPGELVSACRKAYVEGYREMDAFSPIPIRELDEALGLRRTRLPLIVLIGGIIGCVVGFGMQYWVSVYAYPLNIGGKPLNSWPAFIPITFEMTVLFAALSALVGMLALNKMPMPYHPVFNVPRFALASRDRFFLCIQSTDPKFDRTETAVFLKALGASEVSEVAH